MVTLIVVKGESEEDNIRDVFVFALLRLAGPII